MSTFVLLGGSALAFMGALALTSWLYDALSSLLQKKRKFHYTPVTSFLENGRHEFYISLVHAAAHEYRIFAHVHLSDIVRAKKVAQDQEAARSHIDRTCVDFLICHKHSLVPMLAIELFDAKEEAPEILLRTHEVERILKEAHIPCLRYPNTGNFDPNTIIVRIRRALGE